MQTRYRMILICAAVAVAGLGVVFVAASIADSPAAGALPPVNDALMNKYPMSVSQAIAKRRSVRSYQPHALSAEELSLLCWAGQGITDAKSGHRAAPSARAVYPLTLYVATDKSLSQYVPQGHALKQISAGSAQAKLLESGKQPAFGAASVVFVIAMDAAAARAKLGASAEKSCYLEAGHVAQNLLLQATAMNLAGVPATGFDAQKVHDALALPANQQIIYLVPVGLPK
ncbi:MAG: SagB/ThcOx family dehydrogenase [Planctomycetaceae bacterium]|nr:SagB/ThcOx family dehydrogenase [Planctomycetaceae bacterium]